MIIGILSALLILVVCFVVMFIITKLIDLFNKLFRKNCFKCKHWYLHNVASFGDGCEFKCKKTGYSTIPMISINTREHWKKCDEFESKDE